jgi:hypothetical protein
MKTELARELEALKRPEKIDEHRAAVVLPNSLRDRLIEALRTPAIEDGMHEIIETCAKLADLCDHRGDTGNYIRKNAPSALSNPTDAVKPLEEVER